MEEEVSEIKDRLKEAMSIRHMKAVELSEKTGIPKSSISQYLSGRSEPRSDRIYLIARALNIQEAWLLGFDVPMEKTEIAKAIDYQNGWLVGEPARINYSPWSDDRAKALANFARRKDMVEMTKILDQLNDEDRKAVMDYAEFLLGREGKR